MKVIFRLLTLTNLLFYTQCYKILIVSNMLSKSHHILCSSLGMGLVSAGHEVTLITPYKSDGKLPENFKEIHLEGLENPFATKQIENFFEHHNGNAFFLTLLANQLGFGLSRKTLEHPNVQKLLKSGKTFDAVIVEQFKNDALNGLSYHFKAPLILFSTFGTHTTLNELVGNPSAPSYIPFPFFGFLKSISFWARMWNSIFYVFVNLNYYFVDMYFQNKIMKEFLPDVPDLDIINYNSSMVLLNSHVSTNSPVPLVPAMVNIGGFHINPNLKRLPTNLKKLLDKAEDGVIYFSMGLNFNSIFFPENVITNLLAIFKSLKQTVLWKFEGENLSNIPSNVVMGKHFPQQNILAHRNTKLFITHGGLLSLTEAVYFGVPVIAIPIFGDQRLNAQHIQQNGYGEQFEYTDLKDKDKFSSILNNLLTNTTYSEHMKIRSNILHDQPIKPMDLAIFSIEYVIRHKGAKHLRVYGLELRWYQYLLLDVAVFVIAVMAGFGFIFYIILHKFNKSKGAIKSRKIKKN